MLGGAASRAAGLCWILLCCAPRPMDTSPLEEDLLNTMMSKELGWKSYPPSAWQETRFALMANSSHQTYQTCNPQHRNTTVELWILAIERRAARYLYLDLSFALEEETGCMVESRGLPSEANLTVRFTERPRWQQPASVLTFPIPLVRRVPGEYLCESINIPKIRDWLNSVTQQPLGPVSKPHFYLGFRYHGPCFFLASARVYYRQCRAEVAELAHYPQVPGGSEEVPGSCVTNSVAEGKMQRPCREDGQWGPPMGVCRCLAGFEERKGACEACRIGFFKPELGNANCRKCPPKSHSESEGALHCPCLEGFYRHGSNLSEVNCSKPPSAPENATSTINGTRAILAWDPPRNWGQLQGGSFNISCICHSRLNPTAWQPCANLTYHPGCSGLPLGPVLVEGLRPDLKYRFSIEAVNWVSHLQNPAEKSVAAVTVSLPENQDTTVEFMRQQEPSHPGLLGVLTPVVAGCLLTLVILGAVILWRKRRVKPYSSELQVERAVRYRRRTVEKALQLLPIPESLKQTLKDLVLDRNRLTLGRKLATGEFGSVYEGVLTQTGLADVTVAVKTMKDGMFTEEELGSFMSEAELMKSFDHPNVLQLLGVSFQDSCGQRLPMPMLVLPFMKHGDLRSFLLATQHQEVPMTVPLRLLVGFLVNIASGMDYLSRRGFLHRDLAARNCMLREDLQVCVADFGLSRKVYSKEYYRQGAVSRMPVKWMAIESITEYLYTPKTDVWSFGVTMWEVLSCGTTPYPGVQNHEMYLHLQGGRRMGKPPLCPDELYSAMLGCWQERPERRPSFPELLYTLQAVEASLPLGTSGGCEDDDEGRYVNGSLLLQGACGFTAPEDEGRKANVYYPALV